MMRIFKSVLPLLIIALLATYAHQNFTKLPETLASAMQYLPMLLLLIITGIVIHFNQGRVLSYIFVLTALYLTLDYGWFDTDLKFALFAAFAPLLLLIILLLKQQGVFSIRALPEYFLFLITIIFTLWVLRQQPQWADKYLFSQWLPVGYFDWTQLPQTILFIFFVVFVGIVILLTLRQNNLTATALGVLVVLFISLHQKSQGVDLIVLISSGLLLCLYTVLGESWRMAYLDELTQMSGRRALQEKLQSLVGIYSLAMVDVDFFKKFNDKYGHDTGDEVLKMIAAKLKKVAGGGAAYRFGGEEFTLVFANKSVEQVKEYLETIRENIANTAFVVNRRTKAKNKTAPITVSIGVADSINISSFEEVLKQADIALYKAKKKGRNRVVS